jgi:hypothetical protein
MGGGAYRAILVPASILIDFHAGCDHQILQAFSAPRLNIQSFFIINPALSVIAAASIAVQKGGISNHVTDNHVIYRICPSLRPRTRLEELLKSDQNFWGWKKPVAHLFMVDCAQGQKLYFCGMRDSFRASARGKGG